MFSATKYLAAGIILAVVGGVFITTGAPEDRGSESLPAVGASLSAAPSSPTPSESPTTTTLSARTVTNSDLLPGVDLQVMEVAPGVFHILGDGTGHRFTGISIRGFEITTDGQVWLETQPFSLTATGKRTPGFVGGVSNVFRLGVPGRELGENMRLDNLGRPRMNHKSERVCDRGDSPPCYGGVMESFSDGKWRPTDDPAVTFEVQAERNERKAFAADGAEWFINRRDDAPDTVVRRHNDETTEYSFDDLGIELPPAATDDDVDEGLHPVSVAASPVGAVWVHWVSLRSMPHGGPIQDPVQMAVTEFDGDRWTSIRDDLWLDESVRDSLTIAGRPGVESLPDRLERTTMKATDDGTLWLEAIAEDWQDGEIVVELSRWDGDQWSTVASMLPAGNGPDWDFDQLRSMSDGVVWLDGLTFLDGNTLKRFEVPSARKAHTRGAAHAANGPIWLAMNFRDQKRSITGLYVIDPDVAIATPLATAATE